MGDLKQYVIKRKKIDKNFAKNYDDGYADFKTGILLQDLRDKADLKQQRKKVK